MAQASKSGNKTVVRSTNDHDGDGDGRADGVVVVGVSGSARINKDNLLATFAPTFENSLTSLVSQIF